MKRGYSLFVASVLWGLIGAHQSARAEAIISADQSAASEPLNSSNLNHFSTSALICLQTALPNYSHFTYLWNATPELTDNETSPPPVVNYEVGSQLFIGPMPNFFLNAPNLSGQALLINLAGELAAKTDVFSVVPCIGKIFVVFNFSGTSAAGPHTVDVRFWLAQSLVFRAEYLITVTGNGVGVVIGNTLNPDPNNILIQTPNGGGSQVSQNAASSAGGRACGVLSETTSATRLDRGLLALLLCFAAALILDLQKRKKLQVELKDPSRRRGL